MGVGRPATRAARRQAALAGVAESIAIRRASLPDDRQHEALLRDDVEALRVAGLTRSEALDELESAGFVTAEQRTKLATDLDSYGAWEGDDA